MRTILLVLSVTIFLLTTIVVGEQDCHAESGAASLAHPQSEKVVVVLDASGSMWGSVKNATKIDIAKDVVKDIVSKWDKNIDLGLTVYGHRRKSDCEDIESIIPVGPVDTKEFTKVIDGINPKGMTPLTVAVKHAAEELRYGETRATVVLVSDGIETCGADPCAVASELEKSGVDFTTHVIGFGLASKEEEEKLKCIADNTGGKFLTAKDAESLAASLKETVKEVAKSSTGVHLVAVHQSGGKPLDDVRWELLEHLNEPGSKQKVLEYGGGFTPTYRVEPGKYLARVYSTRGKAQAEQIVDVEENQVNTVEVIMSEEGVINLVAVNKEGGEPLDQVQWQLFTIESDPMRKAKSVAYGGGSTPEYKLLPGKYLAKVRSARGKAEAEKEVIVEAGKRVRQEVLIAEEGIVMLKAVHEKGGKPLEGVHWELFTPAEGIEKRKIIHYGGGSTPEVRLLPGKYEVKVNSLRGKAVVEDSVEVAPGKRLEHEVVFPKEGLLNLVAVLEAGGKPISEVRWEIYELETDPLIKPKMIAYKGGEKPEFQLLPGKYRARVLGNRKKFEKEKEVEVVAGQKRSEEIIIASEE